MGLVLQTENGYYKGDLQMLSHPWNYATGLIKQKII